MTYMDIMELEDAAAYCEKAQALRKADGCIDGSGEHLAIVAESAKGILLLITGDSEAAELAGIAGYLSEIGYAVSRKDQASFGALLADQILKGTPLLPAERASVVSAIAGAGDETAVSDPIAAAVILADRTDVRRNRAADKPQSRFTDEDRICYAVTGSNLKYDGEKHQLSLDLQIDEAFCGVKEYMDLFLPRLIACRKAAAVLGCRFAVKLNGKNRF